MDARMPPLKTQYFPLGGGLDSESAQLALKPGVVIGALNYESGALGGYERIGGYERFDGRPRPSDARYRLLRAQGEFTGVEVGDTVTGQTSTATGKVLALRGAYQLVVGRASGTFQDGETLLVGADPVGVFDGIASDVTGFEDNALLALAAADRRADIEPVPGSGPIRGIFTLAGHLYAMRDSAGVTSCDIYKASAAGWVLVPYLRELAFTTGSGTPPVEGATITKGSVSAVVKRVVVESGTWTAGSAAGRFIIAAPTGGAFTAGAFTAGVTATASGADTAITMLPGGRLDAVVYNFTGLANAQRVYGADGVNRGFEFDGDVLVPIKTGMAADKPRHCVAHKGHLFFTFDGSLQHSAIADPYRWSVVVGAGELGIGDEITGLHVLPGDANSGALMVLTPTSSKVLYGNSSADWSLAAFSDDVGAQRWSIQSLGRVIVFDTLGVATVAATQAFGNFDRAPLSARIQRLLRNKLVTASVVNRSDKRMRLFFSSGDGVSITPIPTANGEVLAYMPINYGKVVWCAWSAIFAGEHRNWFGSDDGYVYEADCGRGFDGEVASAYVKLAFNHAKSPLQRKRFRRADIETTTEGAFRMMVRGEYDLGSPDVGLTDVADVLRQGQGAYYDLTSFDESFYDVAIHAVNKIRLDGVGTTLSLTVVSQQANELPHILHSTSVLYNLLRMDR